MLSTRSSKSSIQCCCHFRFTYRLFSETRPLLSRPRTPPHSYGNHPHLNLSAEPPSSSSAFSGGHSSTASRLHQLGWIEYVLPDASVYYVHPTLRITTDINLRNVKKLEAVVAYLAYPNTTTKDSSPAMGSELWLREIEPTKSKRSKAREVFAPVRCWVDHKRRSVSFDPLQTESGHGGLRELRLVGEDRKSHIIPFLVRY